MEPLTICEDQGNLVMSFIFGLDEEKTEYRIRELKISSVEETLMKIKQKLDKYIIKFKKKKRREIRKSGVENVDDLSKELDDTILDTKILDCDGEVIEDLSVTNEEAWKPGAAIVFIFGQQIVTFKVKSLNPPKIKVFKLPEYIMLGYMVYPRMDIENGDKENSSFTWYRQTFIEKGVSAECPNENPPENKGRPPKYLWEEVANTWYYTPIQDDLGHQLKVKCVPGDGMQYGTEAECVSHTVVIPGPECPFENIQKQYTSERPTGKSFRIMTYNILADFYASKDYCKDYMYFHTVPCALELDYRKLLVVKELAGYKSDIICLQEVDQKVMRYDLEPVLGMLGYDGCLKVKRRTSSQGVATFYRKDRFELVDRYAVNMHETFENDEEHTDFYEKMKTNQQTCHLLRLVKAILQVTVLRDKLQPNKYLFVTNTHLYSRPKYPNIRLMQTYVCMVHIQHVIEKYKTGENEVAVVFCGDLNSVSESGVHTLLTTGSVPNNHVDLYGASRQDYVENLDLQHKLRLTSALGYRRYTNYVPHFSGAIDYIYIESDKLKVNQEIPSPPHEDIVKWSALPNQTFPSDHLPQICDLAWV